MRRLPRVRRVVGCIACGALFVSAANLEQHWRGGWQPLWWRALQARRTAKHWLWWRALASSPEGKALTPPDVVAAATVAELGLPTRAVNALEICFYPTTWQAFRATPVDVVRRRLLERAEGNPEAVFRTLKLFRNMGDKSARAWCNALGFPVPVRCALALLAEQAH